MYIIVHYRYCARKRSIFHREIFVNVWLIVDRNVILRPMGCLCQNFALICKLPPPPPLNSFVYPFRKLNWNVALCFYGWLLQERYVLYTTFGPSIDATSPNPFMPQHPVEMSKAGVKVPLVVGFNANEGSFFLNCKFTFLVYNHASTLSHSTKYILQFDWMAMFKLFN